METAKIFDRQVFNYQLTHLPNSLFRQGFFVGLSTTSLINACCRDVTSMATAWATSSGPSILSGLLPSCGENSVCVEPGQITATRMLCPRSSSATEADSPFSPHLEAP